MSIGLRVLFAIVFIFLAACSVETQKGRESFESNHLPQQLAKLANQSLELRPLNDEIVQRVAEDQGIFTLPIAVIDNGVDLAHPDLVGKYMFRVENNQVVGAGHDFMGDDEFSSSVLINPEVMTFTASQIKNGLIVLGDKNPFEALLELDTKVSKAFLEKLKADPVLSKSVFARLSLDSYNAFGLFRIANDKTVKTYFDPTTYGDTQKEGKLLTPDFREKAAQNEVLAKAWNLNSISALLDRPVIERDPSNGLSAPLVFLNSIEHGDLFVQLIQSLFEEMPEAQALKAGIANLVEFRVQRNHKPSVDPVAEANEASDFFSKVTEYHKKGITALDPILNLRSSTFGMKISKVELQRKPVDFPVIDVTPDMVEKQTVESIHRIKEYRGLLNEIPLSSQEKFLLRSFDKNLNTSLAMAQAYLQERKSELPLIFNSDFHSQYTSKLRKYFFRNKHPYLSDFSEREVHGTHVSGIIAKQNEALRIYPVRVTTRSAQITKSEFAKMVQRYKDEFKTWLQNPLVSKTIYHKFNKLSEPGTAEPKTESERLALANALMVGFNEAIDMAFEGGTMDFIFFEELKQSLRHVGEKKIKVANISLGAELINPIPSLAELDPEKDLPKVFAFLNFEFVKYQIGEILSTVSKDTLFVVAAGNSSTWVDGKSHSALPVDVTSRFLALYEDGKSLQAPNNHLENVLAVGSLSPDEDLSSFTNVLLGVRTPMIFAVGENILSPIKTTDLTPALSVISKTISPPGSLAPVSTADKRLLDKAKEKPVYASLKEDSDGDTKISNFLFYGLAQINSILSVYSSQLAIEYNDHRQHLSGTSMATPAIAGTIGDMIVQRSLQLGLQPSQVYDNPEMTPKKLIQNLIQKGQPLFPENPEYPLRKIDVRGKYERGEKIQKLQEKLNTFLKAS
ncbi:MAG: S8 family serine peptidase [Pseudobdellovibrionaceae bacterium]